MKARGLLTRPMCGCGRKAVSTGLDDKGRQHFKTRCRTCIRRANIHRKDYCEHCNKIWQDGKRFDVDHIDNDPSNNDPSNLQTLCRQCHTKKTKEDRDERVR